MGSSNFFSSERFRDLRFYWGCVLTTVFVKLLFLKSYRSTDFEVHRNWLAITHSLPLGDWYYEDRSEWTLDYPPFFAYFEWCLSHVAKFFDPQMLDINNFNYASPMTVLFQKLSVAVMDFVLAYAVWECSEVFEDAAGRNENVKNKLFALIFLNGGLFMVDHIHFQYNGFLFGLLLLSIARIVEEKPYQGWLYFFALVNFKHIFLYVAPPYAVLILCRYGWYKPRKWFPFNVPEMLKFKAISWTLLLISFGPFYQHIFQVLKRMFPFQRGLSHAYWAPNVWAVYNSLDLVLNSVLKQGSSTLSGGKVGEGTPIVLPLIKPIYTFVLTIVVMMPMLHKIFKSPTTKNFLYGVVIAAWTSFMFGYHVHEKAVLNIILPLALLSFDVPNTFFLTCMTGTFSLFPLLFTPYEIILKGLILIFHGLLCRHFIPQLSLSKLESAYIIGFIPLYLLENLGPLYLKAYPFIPLLAVSDYCFMGLFYCYYNFYKTFLKVRSLQKDITVKKSTSRHSTQTRYNLRNRKGL